MAAKNFIFGRGLERYALPLKEIEKREYPVLLWTGDVLDCRSARLIYSKISVRILHSLPLTVMSSFSY